ncbi:MAG TPA: hypothetical protein PK733_15620 [Clostridiales bacterium]|nr:hypothetical protein [Clostridiales bacterium]
MVFGNMRKVVVIKNLPSDFIEEAIFILRVDGKTDNNLLKNDKALSGKSKTEGDCLIKEAQTIINNYIKECEKNGIITKTPNNTEINVINPQKSFTKKVPLNVVINIALIGSIVAFIYLLVRILTF